MDTVIQIDDLPADAIIANYNDVYADTDSIHTYPMVALKFDPDKHNHMRCFVHFMDRWWAVSAYGDNGYGHAVSIKRDDWLVWTGWDEPGCVDLEHNDYLANKIRTAATQQGDR